MCGSIACPANESDDKVTFLQTYYLSALDCKRLHVATVRVLDTAVRKEFQQDHRCVFADIASTKKVIHNRSNLWQVSPGEELRVDDPLQRGGNDSGRDTLAGDVRDDDAHTVFECHCI